MFPALAVGLPQIILFLGVTLMFVESVIATYWRHRGETSDGGQRRPSSTAGIVLQGAGCAFVGVGRGQPTLPWDAPLSLFGSIVVVLLGGSAVLLFRWASRSMGANWSLVARTRGDHQLIRHGPFARVRHPIYSAILLYLFAIAAALGHWAQLIVAVPLYLTGTAIRVRDEEALLRARFGDEHARYVRDVPAIVPKFSRPGA